jgi:hypothetical protein
MNRVKEAREFYQQYLASTGADVRPEVQDDARSKLANLP